MSTPDWRLAFVLPNLCLGQHQRSPPGLSLGLAGIAIVPAFDPRVVEITQWSEAARSFLGSFHDGNGTEITPAVLILRNDWHRDLKDDPEPLIAFRNAVAVTSILPYRAQWQNGGWLGVSWSEAFDYHPVRLRPDGSKFDFWTPALNSVGFRMKGLSMTPDLRVPRTHLCHSDTLLAKRLGQVWYQRYLRSRDKRSSAKVFRSLELAFEALGMRFRSYSSLSEVGLNAVPWVTSMEVLASPDQKGVTKWDCARLIGQHEFSDRRLRSRRYWVKVKRGRHHMNLAQRVFVRLYEARSKFVHGDRVSVKLLLTPGDESPPLLSLASTVYRAALVAYLDEHWPRKAMPNPGGAPWRQRLAQVVQEVPYTEHLLKSIGQSYYD